MTAPFSAALGLRAACASIAVALLFALTGPAAATRIERVVSPSGIEAWLVREPSVPLIAMNFACRGGSSQDPAAKSGLAYMVSALLDEGAGDYDSRAFQERLEAKAIELSFTAGRDQVGGSLRTLTENKDEAFEMLHLALTSARFEPGDIERIRGQILSQLRRERMSPNDIAFKRWWETAFPGHPYGRPAKGTAETVGATGPDDLKAYVRDTFAREGLKIAIAACRRCSTTTGSRRCARRRATPTSTAWAATSSSTATTPGKP